MTRIHRSEILLAKMHGDIESTCLRSTPGRFVGSEHLRDIHAIVQHQHRTSLAAQAGHLVEFSEDFPPEKLFVPELKNGRAGFENLTGHRGDFETAAPHGLYIEDWIKTGKLHADIPVHHTNAICTII